MYKNAKSHIWGYACFANIKYHRNYNLYMCMPIGEENNILKYPKIIFCKGICRGKQRQVCHLVLFNTFAAAALNSHLVGIDLSLILEIIKKSTFL